MQLRGLGGDLGVDPGVEGRVEARRGHRRLYLHHRLSYLLLTHPLRWRRYRWRRRQGWRRRRQGWRRQGWRRRQGYLFLYFIAGVVERSLDPPEATVPPETSK